MIVRIVPIERPLWHVAPFQQWQNARVLAVSAHADSVYVRGMLNAGASGYMLKDNGPGEIVDAIETFMDGSQWIGEGLVLNPA